MRKQECVLRNSEVWDNQFHTYPRNHHIISDVENLHKHFEVAMAVIKGVNSVHDVEASRSKRLSYLALDISCGTYETCWCVTFDYCLQFERLKMIKNIGHHIS